VVVVVVVAVLFFVLAVIMASVVAVNVIVVIVAVGIDVSYRSIVLRIRVPVERHASKAFSYELWARRISYRERKFFSLCCAAPIPSAILSVSPLQQRSYCGIL
jgi:hypothetical protein